MNKLISSIIATTFLTAFGGYWWYGQTEADKTVRHTITKMGLRGAVKYDGIRFNPLTRNVTVNGVKIIDPKLVDFDLTIGGVTMLNLEKEEDFYSRVHFALSDVKFNALDIASKANRDNSTSVLTQLLATPAITWVTLGYKEMQTDLEVDYRYALEDAEDSLTIRFAGQDMGDGQVSFSVVGMPREWTNAVADLLNGQTGQALQVIGGDLMQNGMKDRVKLTRVEASYNDDNFAERYFNYQKIRERWLQGQELPPDDSASENKRIQESVEELVDLGFPKDQSIEFVEAVFAFVKDPDEFEFKAELGVPTWNNAHVKAALESKGTVLEKNNNVSSIKPQSDLIDLVSNNLSREKAKSLLVKTYPHHTISRTIHSTYTLEDSLPKDTLAYEDGQRIKKLKDAGYIDTTVIRIQGYFPGLKYTVTPTQKLSPYVTGTGMFNNIEVKTAEFIVNEITGMRKINNNEYIVEFTIKLVANPLSEIFPFHDYELSDRNNTRNVHFVKYDDGWRYGE